MKKQKKGPHQKLNLPVTDDIGLISQPTELWGLIIHYFKSPNLRCLKIVSREYQEVA